MTKKLGLLLTIAGIAAPAFADPITDARSEILGKRDRHWIVKDMIVFKGAAKQCASGESYRFAADGTAERTICANGKLSASKMSWTLKVDRRGDVVMHLNDQDYAISFGARDGARAMRLQSIAPPTPHSKVSETTEIYMRPAGR